MLTFILTVTEIQEKERSQRGYESSEGLQNRSGVVKVSQTPIFDYTDNHRNLVWCVIQMSWLSLAIVTKSNVV